jgi:hypothetical protein
VLNNTAATHSDIERDKEKERQSLKRKGGSMKDSEWESKQQKQRKRTSVGGKERKKK